VTARQFVSPQFAAYRGLTKQMVDFARAATLLRKMPVCIELVEPGIEPSWLIPPVTVEDYDLIVGSPEYMLGPPNPDWPEWIEAATVEGSGDGVWARLTALTDLLHPRARIVWYRGSRTNEEAGYHYWFWRSAGTWKYRYLYHVPPGIANYVMIDDDDVDGAGFELLVYIGDGYCSEYVEAVGFYRHIRVDGTVPGDVLDLLDENWQLVNSVTAEADYALISNVRKGPEVYDPIYESYEDVRKGYWRLNGRLISELVDLQPGQRWRLL